MPIVSACLHGSPVPSTSPTTPLTKTGIWRRPPALRGGRRRSALLELHFDALSEFERTLAVERHLHEKHARVDRLRRVGRIQAAIDDGHRNLLDAALPLPLVTLRSDRNGPSDVNAAGVVF